METVLNGAARSALGSQAITLAEFDEVVHRHQRRVYRVLYVLLRDRDEADSLTQECFLRAYQNLDRFRGESSLQTWLLRIAVNLAKDHARSRKVSFWKQLLGMGDKNGEPEHFDLPAPGPTPEQAMPILRRAADHVAERLRTRITALDLPVPPRSQRRDGCRRCHAFAQIPDHPPGFRFQEGYPPRAGLGQFQGKPARFDCWV